MPTMPSRNFLVTQAITNAAVIEAKTDNPILVRCWIDGRFRGIGLKEMKRMGDFFTIMPLIRAEFNKLLEQYQ